MRLFFAVLCSKIFRLWLSNNVCSLRESLLCEFRYKKHWFLHPTLDHLRWIFFVKLFFIFSILDPLWFFFTTRKENYSRLVDTPAISMCETNWKFLKLPERTVTEVHPQQSYLDDRTDFLRNPIKDFPSVSDFLFVIICLRFSAANFQLILIDNLGSFAARIWARFVYYTMLLRTNWRDIQWDCSKSMQREFYYFFHFISADFSFTFDLLGSATSYHLNLNLDTVMNSN